MKLRNGFFACILSGVLAIGSLLAGCRSQPPIPAESIRKNSAAAMDDLERRETDRAIDTAEPGPGGGMSAKKPRQKNNATVSVTTGERLAWVDGASKAYPAARYLTGVGVGATRRVAEDRARVEVAKIFYSRVNASTRAYQDYLQIDGSDRTIRKERFDIQTVTDVSTRKVLSGVRIAQVYREDKTQPVYYALAVLNKQQTARLLRYRIAQRDGDIEANLALARNRHNGLEKIRLFKAAVRDYVLRQAMNAELQMVALNNRGIAPPIAFAIIQDELNRVLRRSFRLALEVDGTHGRQVAADLAGQLSRQGFTVTDRPSAANVLVQGRIRIAPLARRSGRWHYVSWQVRFNLMDVDQNTVFGSILKSGRKGHLSLEQATEQALYIIREKVMADVARQISHHIYHDIEP